jgi:hypothetical protein
VKRTTWVTLGVLLLVEAFLAFTPYIPGVAGIWQRDFYNTLATLIGFQFVLLTAGIALTLHGEFGPIGASIKDLVSRSPGTVIRRLRDDEFYREFLRAAEAAKHTVRICYFAPYPPMVGGSSDRLEYYRRMKALMASAGHIRFRRLIRATQENKEWVASLIRELEGQPNVDLALVRDLPDSVENPLGLSVQIVDEDQVWMVAIRSHERVGEHRDLYVRDSSVAWAMSEYFDRLWQYGDEVLKTGLVTPKGARLLASLQPTPALPAQT